MLEKLYKKSEVWFSVAFIAAYVVGNSMLLGASEQTGFDMVYTIPFNLLLLAILFAFIRKGQLFSYYGLNGVKCRAGRLLYYIPLVMIATVNIWTGISVRMDIAAAIVYCTAMTVTGIVEEMLFRGLLFRAMCKENTRNAIIVTSITFGMGHIVNLINGNSADSIATICQLCYAVAIGFLFAAVLLAGKSLIPCIVTHSVLNALSAFSNETVIAKIQIPISITLCIISATGAVMIFRNAKDE